jgi:phenylacetic acid degradation operon negative regulatory protein
VDAALQGGLALGAAQALQLRLVLVHLFRQVALRDPRLPDPALPADWPGHPARRLFARLYRSLSPLADLHVGDRFLSQTGALSAETTTTSRRMKALEPTAETTRGT